MWPGFVFHWAKPVIKVLQQYAINKYSGLMKTAKQYTDKMAAGRKPSWIYDALFKEAISCTHFKL